MTMLITKQAVTEEDAEAVLNASYALSQPFGVPILHIDPADFIPEHPLAAFASRLKLKKAVKMKLSAFLNRHSTLLSHDTGTHQEKAQIVAADQKIEFRTARQIRDIILYILKDYDRHRDDFLAMSFPIHFPKLAVILYARRPDILREEMRIDLGLDEKLTTSFPGTDAHYNFISLWHEIAHSVCGHNETVADRTAAMAFRHAFTDHRPLHVFADMRALSQIFSYNSLTDIQKYGWSCVENIDSVAAMDHSPTWEQVYKTSTQGIVTADNCREAAIQAVGKAIHWKNLKAFLTKDFQKLADISRSLASEGAFSDPEQRMIAQRFSIAAYRFSIGTPAYNAPSPHHSP